MGKKLETFTHQKVKDFTSGQIDGKDFTGSNSQQWNLIMNCTSKLFYASGNYEDQSADFEKKLQVHQSKALVTPSNFEISNMQEKENAMLGD